MKRVLALAAFAAFALPVPAGDGPAKPAKAGANDPLAERRLPENTPEGRLLRQAGEWLLGQMREDPAAPGKGRIRGAFWRQIDDHPFTTDSLYNGVSGVVLSLMTLHEMTGEDRYAAAARRGVRHLIDAAVKEGGGLTWDIAWDDRQEVVHHSRYLGFYTGVTGIAWTLLTYGDAYGDSEAIEAGRRGLDWACASLGPVQGGPPGRFCEGGNLDIIAGNAGIALALLDAYRITGEERYRATAVEAAEALLNAAEKSPEGWSWKSALGWDRTYSGFSHGVAGVAATLAQVYVATGDARFLEAAREGARRLELDDLCVRGDQGVAWRHDTKSKPEDTPWEGWCHGPSGTCRLHLLLYSLTGEKKYLEVAQAGARYILARTDPGKDRAGSGFYAPSLCCGAAGAALYMIEMARVTGRAEYVDYAARVAGFLDRIATRPGPDEACWSLSGRPEGKNGKLWHGTNLMTGQGGYIAFLGRLAQARLHVVRETFLTPDFAIPAAAPGERLLVVEAAKGADRLHASVRRLANYRGGAWSRLADASSPDAITSLARREHADALALAAAPETIDINFHRRAIDAVCRLDDDVFPDASFGYLTGARPEHVRAMLDRMGEVENDGMRPNEVGYGVAELDDLTVYPAQEPKDGLVSTSVYLPPVERYARVRSRIPEALARARGAGFVTFSGNGDPMRIWLFSDQRNLREDLHWKFDPKKVCRDWAREGLTALGAPELAAWEIGGALVQFTTCHSGVPHRALVEGDIVSTFGATGGVARFYDLTPEESLCLTILSRAPCALLAPIGANHGALGIPERDRLHWENLAAGETIRRNQIDVALHWRREGRIPLVQYEDGGPDPAPNGVPGNVMREGTLNRALFGDPTFRPFAALSPGKGSLRVTREGGEKAAGSARFSVAVERPDSFEYWNPYSGRRETGERLVVGLPLRDTERGVLGVALAFDGAGRPQVTSASWTLETRRAAPPVLWVMLEAPATGKYDVKELWRRDVTYRLEVRLGESGQCVGEVALPR